MERFRETKKRNIEEKLIEEKKRQRRSGSETIQFLREQSESYAALRQNELELEREKLAREKQKQDDFKEMMAQQMAQQQKPMSQFQMMFMQENSLLLSILEKVV